MNTFWGNRFGYVHPVHGPIIQIKRGGTGRGGNKGPTGRRATPARLMARAMAEMAANQRRGRR
jgi:hypothetical protein